jgi:phage repressor protein C with HTH and peptisase S24 domain
MTIEEKIIQRLQEADWRKEGKTQKELAEALGISAPAITDIKKGRRRIQVSEIPIMAKFFGIEYEPSQRTIPVVGYIGAGNEVIPFGDETPFDEIPAPPESSAEAFAFQVRGDSMIPAYYDGDYAICDNKRSWSSAYDLIGMECAVKLNDGRMLVKVLLDGADNGRWTLLSYNAPPITGAELEWAAPVGWVRRSRRRAMPAS